MNEISTPETDAVEYLISIGRKNDEWLVQSNFARKLERERDEARKKLSSVYQWIERNHADGFIDSLTYSQNLEIVADNWYDRFGVAERKRDEARKEAEYYKERYEQLKDSREMSDRPEPPKWYNGREIPADIREDAK